MNIVIIINFRGQKILDGRKKKRYLLVEIVRKRLRLPERSDSMIKAVLFDLGGTLHKSSSPPGRDLWFAQRLIERFSDYGIKLEGGAELLAGRLAINSEVYKHESEVTLRELPSAQIWSDYYLREYGLERERIEPFAEELSFLYDYERPCVMRREHLKETMMELKAMGLHLGVISNIISRSVVRHFLAEYGIEALMYSRR